MSALILSHDFSRAYVKKDSNPTKILPMKELQSLRQTLIQIFVRFRKASPKVLDVQVKEGRVSFRFSEEHEFGSIQVLNSSDMRVYFCTIDSQQKHLLIDLVDHPADTYFFNFYDTSANECESFRIVKTPIDI